MPSLLHWFIVQVLKLTRRKAALATVPSFQKKLASLRRSPTDAPPWYLHRSCDIELVESGTLPNACRVYRLRRKETVTPQRENTKEEQPQPEGYGGGGEEETSIFYLHGGCHTFPALSFHWDFLSALAFQITQDEKANSSSSLSSSRGRRRVTVYVVLYPLSPEADYSASMTAVCNSYATHIGTVDSSGSDNNNSTNKPSRVYIAGDSAGAGKALTLVQYIARQQMEAVGKPSSIPTAFSRNSSSSSSSLPSTTTTTTVFPLLRPATGMLLISPWLDTSMSQPDARLTETIDPMLAIEGLLAAAHCYAGMRYNTAGAGATTRITTLPSQLQHPHISPLFGPAEEYPYYPRNIGIWAGTSDLLVHDARAFQRAVSGERQGQEEAETTAVTTTAKSRLLLNSKNSSPPPPPPPPPSITYFEKQGLIHCWPLIGFLPEAKSAVREMAACIQLWNSTTSQ